MIVGIFGVLSLLGIVLLALLQREIPDILTMTTSGVVFYLVGANVAAREKLPPGG